MATEKKPSSVPTADCLSQEWKPALVVVKSEPLDNEEVKLESEVVFEHEDEGMDVDRTVSQEGSVLAAPLKQEPDFPAEKVFVKVEVDNTDEENLGSSNNQDTHMEVEQNVTQEDSILTAPPKEDPKFPAESVFVKVEMGCSDDGNLNSSGNKGIQNFTETGTMSETGSISYENAECAKSLSNASATSTGQVRVTKGNLLIKLGTHNGTGRFNIRSPEALSFRFVQNPSIVKVAPVCEDSSETVIDHPRPCPMSSKQSTQHIHNNAHLGSQVVYPCTMCSERFSSVMCLSQHLFVHPNYRPFPCQQCSLRFKSRDHLTQHRRRGCSPGVYGCPQCRAQYATTWGLEQHYASHFGGKPREINCHLCPQSFLKKTDLKQHLLSHDVGPKINNVICHMCSASFDSVAELDQHVRIHAGSASDTGPAQFLTQSDPNHCSVVPTVNGTNPYNCRESPTFSMDQTRHKQHLMEHHIEDPHTDSEQIVTQEGSIPSDPSTSDPQFAAERLFVKVEVDDADGSLDSSENQGKLNFTEPCETEKSNCSNQSSSESSSYHFVECPPINQTEPTHDNSEETDVDCSRTCPICSKRFKRGAAMQLHLASHDVNAHPCELCSESFSTATRLREHLPFHADLREFPCPECSFRFKLRSHLDKHLARDCSSGVLGCPQCPAEFATLGELEQHYTTHFGEKQLVHQCEQCPRTFYTRRNLIRHAWSHRAGPTERNIVCPICSEQFVLMANLERHMKTHADDAPHVCRQCQVRFMTQHELNQHTVQHIMKGENPYQCSKCPQSCLSEFQLKQHLAKHDDAGKFRCPDCLARFRKREHLKQHVLIHVENGPFTCPHCYEEFQRKRYFDRHVNSHIDEKPFRCEQCPEWFQMESELVQHLEAHANEKKFCCAHCGVRRKDKNSIRYHIRSHMEPSSKTDVGNSDKKMKNHFYTKNNLSKTYKKFYLFGRVVYRKDKKMMKIKNLKQNIKKHIKNL